MSGPRDHLVIDPARLDAVLFDLDGVLTSTAALHDAAWTEAFNAFLADRAGGGAWTPFDPVRDYRDYVDGKPRDDGVRSFLASRGITLPEGALDDPPGHGTVNALANLKNVSLEARLAAGGVEAFPGSVAFLDQVRTLGLRTAVVSSSRNCLAVITAAGIADRFDARVDGVVGAERGLAGKPSPAYFLAAAADLGVPPGRAVVVEDAVAGVEAGRAGAFGLVIGVARVEGAEAALRAGGADLVVGDLGELVAA